MAGQSRWTSKFTIKDRTCVFVPTEESVQIGQEVKADLQHRWPKPSFYYHLSKGGHVAALNAHTHHKFFLHLDIKDFFSHVNRSRITRCLKGYFGYEKAREIAIQSTVQNPESNEKEFVLPFGFVQSPILASVCLSKSALGRNLKELHQHPAYAVTVYMDDIIVSANELDLLEQASENLQGAAEKSRFPLNDRKQEGPADCVTSFNIKLCQGSLAITNERLSKFSYAHAFSTNEHQRAGILEYVRSVNPEQADTIG